MALLKWRSVTSLFCSKLPKAKELKTSKSLMVHRPHTYGHNYPPTSFPATLTLVHPVPAILASLHCHLCTKEIWTLTAPFAWKTPSLNIHLADSYTTFQEFCSDLNSHSGLSWFPYSLSQTVLTPSAPLLLLT